MLKKILHNNSFISLLTNGLLAFFGLINFGLLARYLSTAAFGEWLYFLVLLGLLEMLRSGLLQTALLKFKGEFQTDRYRILLGSSWLLAIVSTLGLLLLIGIVQSSLLLFYPAFHYQDFAFWLLCILIAGLPYNFSLWLFQAESQFKKILLVRTVFQVLFLIYILLSALLYQLDLVQVFTFYTLITALVSLLCLILKWTQIGTIFSTQKEVLKQVFHFGKYSMGTLVASNLLRSSDNFLIGIFMSPTAVALYGVPFKLIELLEMPLRSFVSVFMPKMAKALANDKDKLEAKRLYVRYAGFLSLLFVPAVMLVFCSANYLVVALSGKAYASSGVLLQILIVYALFLPLDRLSGVSLDLLGYPQKNLLKVILMLSINVIGDYFAIKYFNDLRAVAVVSILTFFSGLWFGNFYLKKYLPYTILETLRDAPAAFKQELKQVLKRS